MGNVERRRSQAVRNVDKSFVHTGQLIKAGERYHAGKERGPRIMAASFAERQVADFIGRVHAAGVEWTEPLDQTRLEAAIAGIENQKLQDRFRQHGQLVWDALTKSHPPLAHYTGVLIWRSVDPQKPLSLEYQYIID